MMIVRLLAAFINLYALCIVIRILISWMPRYGSDKVFRFFDKITDPYLNIFRKIRFLRIGPIDFSAIIALIVLSTVQIVMREWVKSGSGSLLLIPLIFASSLLNVLGFFCFILAIAIITRIIILQIGKYGVLSAALDQLLQPIVSRLFRIIHMRKNLSYMAQLIIASLLLFGAFFLLRFMSAWIFLR